ncbi:MAG: TolC family outer membrane protein, partial [Hyphomicrobiaceae bacterium]|nr:TolC family outer membrane protein [Hyphomicrobiaceae bacterium]
VALRVFVLSVCFVFSGFCGARAESLLQALASAYMTNPTLNAERAALRATDEEISQARSNFRPSLTGDLDAGYRNTNPKLKSGAPGSGGTHHPKALALTLNKSLFRGFRTLNAIREAEANIQSGRANLRDTEQTVLLDGVTAYMDVFRDQAIVRLRESNVRVLSEQQKATKDRFEVGEVTKTDVAQSEARRSGSVSDLSLAQSNLKTSRAAYQQIIGHPPSSLIEPQSIEGLLPRGLQGALGISGAENPNIVSALFAEEASRYAIKQIIGEMLPELSVEATISDSFEPSISLEQESERRITGRLRVPLYTRGEPSSRARQARQVNWQRRREIDEARAQANADVIAAWGRLISARAQIISDQEQVRANKIALNGVKEEEKVGQRTLLDVLDAEQELLDSQVALVSTQRDRVVAAFTLLAAIGRLDAHFLRLPVQFYDPMAYYDKIKHKLFGTYADRAEREQFKQINGRR